MSEAGAGWTAGLSDSDLREAMLRALRLLLALAAVATAAFWWKAGWRSGALVMIGAGISAASLWEWLRLVTVFNESMDAAANTGPEGGKVGKSRRPLGLTVAGFFLRLILTVAVLYVSLKYLNGTVFALAAGIGLGLVSLTIQALRLLNRWTR